MIVQNYLNAQTEFRGNNKVILIYIKDTPPQDLRTSNKKRRINPPLYQKQRKDIPPSKPHAYLTDL